MKIDKEVAQKEFERWANAWRIEIEESELSEEDQESFNEQRRKVVKAIEKGYLTVSEDGAELVLDTDKGPVTFSEPKGAAYLSMDQHKNKNMASSFGFMGSMTGTPAKFWSSVRGADVKIAQAITALFLAS